MTVYTKADAAVNAIIESNWVDDILEDLRMSAEWTIESEEE